MKHMYKLPAVCGLFLLAQLAFAAGEVTGKVAETINVSNYVYVLLEEDNLWLAASLVEVRVGDRVEYIGGAPMKNFYSRELDRTFEDILFVTRFKVIESANSHGSIADLHMLGAEGAENGFTKGGSVTPPTPGEIERLEGGRTIEEVLVGTDELEGKQISIRARVIKVSTNILGKNWITLQDGTGTAPNNKLIATTSEIVNVGDTVIANGIVQSNVDIGSGYKYKVVLEEATFTK